MSLTDHDLVRLLASALAETGGVVAATDPDRWKDPTPCATWDVGRLVSHLVTSVDSFAALAGGLPMPAEEPPLGAAEAGPAFAAAADRALRALSAPGALDRVYEAPWGPTPGRLAASFLLIETIVHGWDLATATGREVAFDDEAVATALEISRASADESTRTPELFGPAVPVARDAPPLEQLVAWLGRRPGPEGAS